MYSKWQRAKVKENIWHSKSDKNWPKNRFFTLHSALIAFVLFKTSNYYNKYTK